ncbi:MAG: HNH endonuclease, partial [Candidatus Poseidoniaceae archaeon]
MHLSMNKTSVTGEDWSDYITPEILSDISYYVSGERKYEFEWIEGRGINADGSGPKYNVGQVAVVDFDGVRHYITLGKPGNDGRNSYFQSIGPAFRRLLDDPHSQKSFNFYALPNLQNTDDQYEEIRTQYHTSMFRVLMTIGWGVNWDSFRGKEPDPISSFHELIQSRENLVRRNNNPTYGYTDQEEDENTYHLFAKTYGSSKYESFMLALAALKIDSSTKIELHSLEEGKLSQLPDWCIHYLEHEGDGRFKTDSLGIEMDQHRQIAPIFPPPLRSPRHRQNLRNWAGSEKCVFCEQDNPNMIHAAHILEVRVLKSRATEGDDELNLQLITQAIDGANGLWACHDHHHDFDHNRLSIRLDGAIVVNPEFGPTEVARIFKSLTTRNLGNILSNPEVGERIRNYLRERHQIALENGIDIREWTEFSA